MFVTYVIARVLTHLNLFESNATSFLFQKCLFFNSNIFFIELNCFSEVGKSKIVINSLLAIHNLFYYFLLLIIYYHFLLFALNL